MSKITQQLDNIRDEKATEQIDLIADENRREEFIKEEQKEEQERNAFALGKSRRNLYEELSKEGIEEDRYSVNLTKVTTATTAGGKPIVRFTYRLAESYEFKGEELANVHINTTSSDEWNEQYNTNFALQTLGTLYDVVGADDEGVEMTTQGIVSALQSQLDEGLNEKEFMVNVRKNKSTANGSTAVFYTVYFL